MQRNGSLVPLLFAAAVAGTTPLHAQEQTVEDRLLHAFQKYCVNSLGDPALTGFELRKLGWTEGPGGVDHFAEDGKYWITVHTSWIEQHKVALRRLHVDMVEGAKIPTRTCQVSVPFADKAAIGFALVRHLALGEPTSPVASETSSETELTRWTMRVGRSDATVEFRTPIYSGAPGYSLTLIIQRQ